jgi:hypothetical protein
MKHENLIFTFIIFIIFSCNSKDYKAELIGKWNFIEYPEYCLTFTKDSLFINSTIPTKQNWNADGTNIFLKNMTDLNMNKLLAKDFRNHFLYTLNVTKDTLEWRAEKDSTRTHYKFVRVVNNLKSESKEIE